MKIKLIRNLNTIRNKEQEDSFELTMNLSLFFDSNKTLSKIDGWSFSNVKRLVRVIEPDTELTIEFDKWNDNVDYIFTNINPEINTLNEVEDNIKMVFINRDIKAMHEYILSIKEDKNKKFELLLFLSELIKNNAEIINLINIIINKGISTIDLAIDSILPLLIMEEVNE